MSSRSVQARERLAIQRLGRGKPAPIGHSAIKPALLRALSTGGATRPRALTIAWDVAGTGKLRCTSPRYRTIETRQGVDDVRIRKAAIRPRSWLDMTMRCRKCPECLRLRAHQWTTRASIELGRAPRTWFGTMTLSPDMHLRCQQIAHRSLGRKGDDFDALSPDEQFAERHRVISRWLTLWVKRVRKAAGADRLRFMVVCEAHQSGLPHYHALIHEVVAFATNERELRNQWFYGFSKFRLVYTDEDGTGKVAWYMAKYLTKSTRARVRASCSYGEPSPSIALDAKTLPVLCKTKTTPHTLPQGLVGVPDHERKVSG